MSGEVIEEDDDGIIVTEADFAAADKVLETWPSESSKLRLARRRYIAWLHAYSKKNFRLYFNLRKPRSEYERLQYLHFHQKITDDEFRESLRKHAERAVDAQMIRELYEQLESRLKQYSKGLQSIAFTTTSRCRNVRKSEQFSFQCLKRACSKVFLDRQELGTLFDFLSRLRVEKQMGVAIVDGFSAPTTMDLVFLATKRTLQSWENCLKTSHQSRAGYSLREFDASSFFIGPRGPRCPTPQSILALMYQEKTAAEIKLEELLSTKPSSQTFSVENATFQVANGQINGHFDATEATEPMKEKPVPFMSVGNWSQLAIAIDEERRYWAMSSPPAFGDYFLKSNSRELPLTGPKWRSLTELLAEAPNTGMVTEYDALRVLGYNPPKPASRIEHDSRYELRSRENPLREKLNKALKSLANDLREHIAGPTGKGVSAFSVQGNFVICRFKIAFLMKDDEDRWRFGPRQI